MADAKEALKCPACGSKILKVANTNLVKCENNLYENGVQKGCDFIMDLKPKVLKGQQVTRDQLGEMLNGETVGFKVGTGHIDPTKANGFYFVIEFPENEVF